MVGMYKIVENGLIYDVILFFVDVLVGEGVLIVGEFFVDFDVSLGDYIGFFMLLDFFMLNEDFFVFVVDCYELCDWGGSFGNIYEDIVLCFYVIDEMINEEIFVEVCWNVVIWYMYYNVDVGIFMNFDGVDYVCGLCEYDNSIMIGFFDIYGNSVGLYESILLNVNFSDSGVYIEDDDIVSDVDQIEYNWIVLVEIVEYFLEVFLVVRFVL